MKDFFHEVYSNGPLAKSKGSSSVLTLVAALGTGLVYGLCLGPVSQEVSVSIPHLDKLVHFLMNFFLMSVHLAWGFSGNERQKFFLSCLHAFLSEFLQIPLEYRDFSLFDLLANLLGQFTAFIMFWHFGLKIRQRLESP